MHNGGGNNSPPLPSPSQAPLVAILLENTHFSGSGVATGGAIAPPGSILTLEKYTFSYVAPNVKDFFWALLFRF